MLDQNKKTQFIYRTALLLSIAFIVDIVVRVGLGGESIVALWIAAMLFTIIDVTVQEMQIFTGFISGILSLVGFIMLFVAYSYGGKVYRAREGLSAETLKQQRINAMWIIAGSVILGIVFLVVEPTTIGLAAFTGITSLASALGCYLISESKHYSELWNIIWVILGGIFSILAVAVVLLIPDNTKPAQQVN